MKKLLSLCLLLAGCQPKNDKQSSVIINGKEYTDSVSVDSAGNHVRVKSGAGRVRVSGSNNTVDIK